MTYEDLGTRSRESVSSSDDIVSDEPKTATLADLLALIDRNYNNAQSTVTEYTNGLTLLADVAGGLRTQASELFSKGQPGWKDVQRLQKDAGKMEHTVKVAAKEFNLKTSAWQVGSLAAKEKAKRK